MAYPRVLLEILVLINQQDTPPFLPTASRTQTLV